MWSCLCLFVSPAVTISFSVSVPESVSVNVCVSACMYVCLCTSKCVYPSVYLSTSLSFAMCVFVYPFLLVCYVFGQFLSLSFGVTLSLVQPIFRWMPISFSLVLLLRSNCKRLISTSWIFLELSSSVDKLRRSASSFFVSILRWPIKQPPQSDHPRKL